MVSNIAKLDRRTKQHTQFGDSASNGSRDMGWTILWQNRGVKKKINNKSELDGKPTVQNKTAGPSSTLNL